jgi:hypothetical protein
MPRLRAFVAGSLLVLGFVGACAKRDPAGVSAVHGTSAPDLAARGEPLATSFGGAEAQAPAEDEPVASEGDAPSLGTAYGEARMSAVRSVPFERASSTPAAVLAIFYDDVASVRRRGERAHDFGRLESRVTSDDGALAVSLVDDRGRVYPAAQVGDRTFALGSQGLAYRIGIENHARERFEAVASVDGLDVMDGSEAGFEQRGYVVEPFTSMVVEGWRTSEDTVAAFRFSEIEDSYAERTGRARNVGVVGVAFFREEAASAFHQGGAQAFPRGRFAPAPPRR